MRITIEFNWEELGAITLSPAGRLIIPRVPVEPGVYRFRIPTETRVEVYIGQASNLRRRMGNYAGTYRGATATRIRTVLLDHLAAGRSVKISIARQAHIGLDGKAVDASFALSHVRLLVENTALALAWRAGKHPHNL